jgi:hypothetical protein
MATSTYQIAIDGHVHIYPGYDVSKAVNCLIGNLGKIPITPPLSSQERGGPVSLGLLAESRSCRFYKDILQHGSPVKGDKPSLAAGPDEGCLSILESGVIKGYLIAGRQIVTAERLEILGLGIDVAITDGLPAEETLQAIRAQGAVPVLSWSPGKWFFARGKLVKKLIETHSAGDFLIGDTGLRPAFWPLPRLMQMASQRGYTIIGGSDPLPLPGEEPWIGTYGITTQASFDPEKPAQSLRRLLADTSTRFTLQGRRCPPLAFTSRWIKNQFCGKKNVETGGVIP